MQKIINVVIAVAVSFFLVKACNRQMEINSWEDTKAHIASYEIEEYSESKKYKSRDGKTKTKWEDEFRVNFTYTYTIDGIAYSGKFSVDDLDTQREIDGVLRRTPTGKSVRIKYDPNNPSDNVYKS